MSLRAPLLPLSFALLALPALTSSARADDLYEVTAGQAKAAVGARATASVTLLAKNGWHVNEQAPVSLKLTPGAGLSVEKNKLGRKDLAESTKDRARFDVAFTASEPGKRTIDCEASFVICQESACKPVKQKVAVAVEAMAPAKK